VLDACAGRGQKTTLLAEQVGAGGEVWASDLYPEKLEALAGESADPIGFADAVEANIASREDNVRAALARVELGEADAAFVYRTDALGSEDAVEIELPPAARVGAVYSVVLLSEKDAAARFLEWLRGPEVRDILRGAGFEVVA